jgi:hypothetical protein
MTKTAAKGSLITKLAQQVGHAAGVIVRKTQALNPATATGPSESQASKGRDKPKRSSRAVASRRSKSSLVPIRKKSGAATQTRKRSVPVATIKTKRRTT